MKFMFYTQGRAPIETSGTYVTVNFERLSRPVPRIGETVYLDAEYYVVKNVIHLVQGNEVRIYVERI